MTDKYELKIFVAERVKYLRTSKNLSQEALSVKADLEPKYINRLENKHYNLSIDTLNKVINALDVSYQEFFDAKLSEPIIEVTRLTNMLTDLPVKQQKEISNALLILVENIKKRK